MSMWIMSLTIPYSKGSLMGYIAKKNNITFFGYPHTHTFYSDYIRVISSCLVLGDKKDIRNAISDLKKDSRLLHIEVHGSQFLLDVKQGLINKGLFQSGLLYTKPGMATSNGDFVFEIASWKKEQLMKIYRIYGPAKVKLNWIKQKKITSIQVKTSAPNLTDKQDKALRLAIDMGYYGYPRKIDIVHLAKEFGCSSSTFQFHLRNAEKKVMPSIYSV